MEEIKKTVVLYPFEKPRHSLYTPVIEFLKERYNIIYNPTNKRGDITPWFRFTKWYPARWTYHKFIRPILSYNEVKSSFKKSQQLNKDYDLIYSVAKVPNLDKPYIIDFEKINNIADHAYDRIDKEFLESEFSKPNCKAIIPWYDIAERSLRETIDCSNFSHKIKTIPFGIKSDKIEKRYDKNNIEILFVSSRNNPLDFEFKGGIITLEVYKKLLGKYPNIGLTIRAHIPGWVKEKYGDLPRLKFIDSFMERKELLALMIKSDLLIQPKLGTQLALESMNFAIPAITFDEWEMPEMIINRFNGFNVDCSHIYGPKKTKEEFQKYLKNFHLNYLKMYNKNPPKKIIQDFIDKASILIEDKELRKKMSINAKSLIEPGGRYNFDKMKKELLEVFERSF